MSIDNMYAAIEAVLFAMGESVEVSKIASAIGQDVPTTVKLIHRMMERYEAEDRGIKLIELGDSFQLCTKAETYEYIIKIASQPKKQVLTDVLLETLSIIAYKQPITKQEIEGIRGVSCEHAVNKLVEYGLVDEVGRLDAPGRPILFGTTEEFLRSFGVRNVDELPVISPDKVEDFRKEAESETEKAAAQDGADGGSQDAAADDDIINLGI